MGYELLALLWVVVVLGLLLPPLLRKNSESFAKWWPWLTGSRAGGLADMFAETSDGEGDESAGTGEKTLVTDGGHRCHRCGAHVDAEFTYCGECLTPRP